jgi:hypothetical protein
MRVVIGGMAKSGTTALFYAVRSGMPRGTLCLFEPKRYWPVPVPHVLAKILANPGVDWDAFQRFGKKLYIVRDPRDRLISAALYWVYGLPAPISESQESRLIALLRRKEALGRRMPFLEVCDGIAETIGGDRVNAYLRRLAAGGQQFLRYPEYHRVRYEDFVAGDVGAVEAYLGRPLAGGVKVDPLVRRVERTRGAGDWRNWFTPADVDYFRPRMLESFRVFGYEDVWDLPDSATVNPRYGSEYLARLIGDHRRQFAEPRLRRGGWRWLRRAVLFRAPQLIKLE